MRSLDPCRAHRAGVWGTSSRSGDPRRGIRCPICSYGLAPPQSNRVGKGFSRHSLRTMATTRPAHRGARRDRSLDRRPFVGWIAQGPKNARVLRAADAHSARLAVASDGLDNFDLTFAPIGTSLENAKVRIDSNAKNSGWTVTYLVGRHARMGLLRRGRVETRGEDVALHQEREGVRTRRQLHDGPHRCDQ